MLCRGLIMDSSRELLVSFDTTYRSFFCLLFLAHHSHPRDICSISPCKKGSESSYRLIVARGAFRTTLCLHHDDDDLHVVPRRAEL